MSDLDTRLANLSPEKLELLRARLRAEPAQAEAPPRPVEVPLPPIEPRPEERFEPFPLTEVQEAYWAGRSGLFDLGAGGANSYMEYQFRGVGNLFLDRLEWAFQSFVERHDMLRTILLPDGRQQVLREVPPFRIQRVDLTGRPAEEVEQEIQRVRDRMCWESFATDRWPLFEVVAQLQDDFRLRLHLRFDALLKDGRSRSLILDEVPQLFTNPDAELAPVGVTYRDFAVTRVELQQHELFTRSRDYWLERIPALPPAPEIPLAVDLGPRTPSHFRLRSVDLLSAEEWQRLKSRATRKGLTPSSVVLAAYVEAIAAWSDSPRFTLGMIGAERPPVHPDIEGVFGNFNTLYLLGVDDRSGSFAERAKRLQAQVSSDLENRHFSGLQVIREINRRSRGTSRALAPFCFNSVVRNHRGEGAVGEETWAFPDAAVAAITAQPETAEQTTEATAEGAADADATPATPAAPAPPPDWMVEIEGSVDVPQILLLPTFLEGEGGTLVVKWQAVRDAFPEGLLDDLLAGLTRLLERLADDDGLWQDTRPHLAVSGTAAPAVPAAPTAAPDGALLDTLTGRLAAWAAARPAETAVIAGDLTLTWSELLARADRLAAQLQHLGARPGRPVALAVDRGGEEAVGALAILRAGAAILPLSPGADAARLLDRSGATLAVTTAREEGQGWPQRVARVTVDIAPTGNLSAADGKATDPVWIVYDATGTQGAVLEHRALLATLQAAGERFGFNPADRLLTLSPAGGDAALFDLFSAWLVGAAVVYPAGAADPARQAAQAAAQGVTVWSSPAAVFSHLLAHLEARPDAAPRSLRLVLAATRGRDALPLSLPGRAAARLPGVEVAALAGFPEAGTVSATPALATTPAEPVSSFPWDRPLAGHTLHVLDSGLEPRPTWVAGDLYISGAGLARGYWQDEEATRAAFVTHPRTGERLFHTGLLARRLPDGTVEPLGRPGEHPIEAAGRRIQPRRIEAWLERQPGVRAAAVLPREDGDGRTRLTAFVETATAIQSFVAGLRAGIELDLPPHLVPATLDLRHELPRTAAGEIDREALAAALVPEPAPVPTPPRSSLERDLTAIWREVLGLDAAPPSVHDNFFDLGGTSVLAARMMIRVVQRFGLGGPLPAFLDRPTVGHLATLVQKAQTERRERERGEATGLRRLFSWLPRRRAQAPAEPVPPGGMRTFIILWIGQFISGMGTGLGSFSLGVWTFDQGQSAAQYTMVGFCAMVTGMFMMPVAGSFADRYDRRKLILYGDAAAAFMTLIMAVALYTGHLRVWHVYPIAILMTAFSALQGPALFASISTLVPRRHLIRAGTMSQLIGTAVGMTTPFLAGVLVGKIGYHGVILLDFITFFAAAGTLLYIRFPEVPRSTETSPGRPSILRDIGFGWSYLRARPGLLSLLMLFAVTNFSAGIVQALLTPLIRSFASITELGTVQSAAAVGALLGSVALSIWGGPPQGTRVWAIFVCMIVQGALLLLGGFEPNVPLVACALFLATLTAPIVGGSSAAIWQTKIAHDVQGRIFGLRGMLASSTVPLAFLLSGFLADQIFEPLLAPGGALAGSVGAIIGVGPGRGIGFLYILLGLFMIAWILIAFLNPRLRNVETELPDMPRPGVGGGAARGN